MENLLLQALGKITRKEVFRVKGRTITVVQTDDNNLCSYEIDKTNQCATSLHHFDIGSSVYVFHKDKDNVDYIRKRLISKNTGLTSKDVENVFNQFKSM